MSYTDPPTGDAALANNYYVDLSADSDFPSFLVTRPENLTFDDQINGIGNIAFQYSFEALDLEDNPVIKHNFMGDSGVSPFFIGPWRSFYRLRCGTDVIHEGPITNFHGKLGDQFLSVAGKTWEAYMPRWQYPYDPRDGHLFDYAFSKAFQGNELTPTGQDIQDTGQVYMADARDLTLILTDLFDNAMNLVSNRMIFDLSGITNSGVTTRYMLSVGDTRTFESILNDLAGTGEGFDWWIGHGKRFYTGTPRRYGNPQAPNIVYYITIGTNGIANLEFDNQGPGANHIWGRGAGWASGTTLGIALGYGASQTEYTRLDRNYDFGDVRDLGRLTAKAERQLALDLDALHSIPLSLDPTLIPNFWSTFRKGRAIHILYDLYFHTIQSPQQIKSYSCTVTNEGNATVDFNLEQIYPDHDYDVGTAEG